MVRKPVVFVHGWSVRNTNTYGKLPERLIAEADAQGLAIDVRHIYLGQYVSFRDEVRVADISQALDAALTREPALQDALQSGQRLAMITHSTGGPVARDWWHRYHVVRKRPCPLSHLIMLAPANFGSALAQLGKSTVSRLKSWFQGVEPGQGVLDWLELGSPEAWQLNESWVRQRPKWSAQGMVYPFVLTGQTIDRALYDHVNSYTDEVGSDGVVRVAAADLNATYVQLVQEFAPDDPVAGAGGPTRLVARVRKRAPRTALAVLPGLAHSGTRIGIMRSVKLRDSGALRPHPTVAAIIRCLAVKDDAEYEAVCDEFAALTAQTQEAEKIERVKHLFLFEREFRNPVTAQMIVRVRDEDGRQLDDFDFLLTSWDPSHPDTAMRSPNPNLLPPGFFIDRQRNRRTRGTLTYFLDHEKLSQAPALGVRVTARPTPDPTRAKAAQPFVHHVSGELAARTGTLLEYVQPNATLMLDIVLKRVVREGVFRLTRDLRARDFTRDEAGDPVA
jgi:hypothetical protein